MVEKKTICGVSLMYLLQRKSREKLVSALVRQHFNISNEKEDVNTILKFIEEHQGQMIRVPDMPGSERTGAFDAISVKKRVESKLKEQGYEVKYPEEFAVYQGSVAREVKKA